MRGWSKEVVTTPRRLRARHQLLDLFPTCFPLVFNECSTYTAREDRLSEANEQIWMASWFLSAPEDYVHMKRKNRVFLPPARLVVCLVYSSGLCLDAVVCR